MKKTSTHYFSLCPVCGQSNSCAIANNSPVNECWCMQVTIPESLRNNSAVKNNPNQCICAACIKKQTISIGESYDQ